MPSEESIITLEEQVVGLLKQLVSINTDELHRLTQINVNLEKIAKALGVGVPVKLQIHFKGVPTGMPVTLTDTGAGSTVIATPSETDALGNAVTVDPTQIGWAVSDATAINVQANPTATAATSPDGQTIPPGGAWFQAAQSVGHLGAFQVTETDASNSLTAVDTVTVVSGKATTIGINFGTPV